MKFDKTDQSRVSEILKGRKNYSERGSALLEYAILAGLLAVSGLASYSKFFDSTRQSFIDSSYEVGYSAINEGGE